MKAQERLYLTADRNSLVGQGSPKAAFLYAAVGDDIPPSAVEKFGLVDGRLKPKAEKPPAEKKEQKPAQNKEQKPDGNKGQNSGGAAS